MKAKYTISLYFWFLQAMKTRNFPLVATFSLLKYRLKDILISQQKSKTTRKNPKVFIFSYREIVRKSARALSAPKTGVHHTSMSFSGPSKNPTLSISRIHAINS